MMQWVWFAEGFELNKTNNWFQKIWWWIITLVFLTRDIDGAIKRLQARQSCANSGSKIDPIKDSIVK